KEKSKKLTANINIELGNYYFNQKNYYLAVSYYIEACNTIKKLIYQIPKEFRLKFVNNYKLGLPFYRIKYIDECNVLNNTKFETNIYINSHEELNELINNNSINKFINNKNFLYFLSKQLMPKGIYTEKDIL